MPSPIELTPELLANVAIYLGTGDLSSLMRVSKAHHRVIEPFLWTMVELHSHEMHATAVHKELGVEIATARQTLPYELSSRPWHAHRQAERFVEAFSPIGTLQRERQSQLGSLVKFLCMPLIHSRKLPGWASFEHFANLTYLELSGYWRDTSTSSSFVAPEQSLSKLCELKLRGYFPRTFVQWLLRVPAGIEELQLAILDAPVGSSNVARGKEWENPPPLENQDPDDIYNEELERWETPDYESLVHEWVAPRGLACLTPEIIQRFANLKVLYLCKPSDGEDEDTLYFSEPSDRAIIDEWTALLKATRRTLEMITLDQRPVAAEDVGDGTGNNEYIREYANGASYKRFVRSVLPVLLDSTELVNLKAIRLFGFECSDEVVDLEYARQRMYPNDSVDVPSQLRAAFPDAEIIDGVGRRLVIENASGVVMSSLDILETLNSHDSDSEDEP